MFVDADIPLMYDMNSAGHQQTIYDDSTDDDDGNITHKKIYNTSIVSHVQYRILSEQNLSVNGVQFSWLNHSKFFEIEALCHLHIFKFGVFNLAISFTGFND
jgi:hypothetical protein